MTPTRSFALALALALFACQTSETVAPPPCPPVTAAPPPPVAAAPAAAAPPVPTTPKAPVAAPLDKNLARPEVIEKSAPLPGFTKGINLGNCLDAPAEG